MLTATVSTQSSTTFPESPYRGIESFRYVDEPIFFAREEETRKLLRYVAVYRGVLFYGESGCGKSSLINAGFIPAALEEGFTPDRLRVQPKPGEEIIVERISTTNTGLAPYLASSFASDDDETPRLVMSADNLKKHLEKLRESSPTSRPVLIFDQFEEFATLFEEVPRGDAVSQAQAAQQAILKLIVDLQRDITLPVKLLFSFREDYLAKLSKLITLWPDLSDQGLRLTPPGIEALPSIIRGSFDKFPGSFGKELSASLTRELATAIETRNEGGKINLSEVQIACLELWKARDPEALFRQKRVQGLLEDYLSASLDQLPKDLRDPAIALLSRMVTPSGTRNVVSEYDLVEQVHDDEGIAQDILKSALQALVKQTKLVRRERRYNTFFYDIVSEFLVPWISRQKVERLAAIENRKLEEVEKRKRTKAFGLAAASLLLALGVVLAWFMLYRERNRTVAERNRTVEQQKQTIELQKEKVFLEISKDEAVKKARDAEIVAEKTAAQALQDKAVADGAVTDLKKQLEDSQKEAKTNKDQLSQKTTENVDKANALARSQALEAYNALLTIQKDLVRFCTNLSQGEVGRQEGIKGAIASCNRMRSEIANVSAGLRKIGRGPAVQ